MIRLVGAALSEPFGLVVAVPIGAAGQWPSTARQARVARTTTPRTAIGLKRRAGLPTPSVRTAVQAYARLCPGQHRQIGRLVGGGGDLCRSFLSSRG